MHFACSHARCTLVARSASSVDPRSNDPRRGSQRAVPSERATRAHTTSFVRTTRIDQRACPGLIAGPHRSVCIPSFSYAPITLRATTRAAGLRAPEPARRAPSGKRQATTSDAMAGSACPSPPVSSPVSSLGRYVKLRCAPVSASCCSRWAAVPLYSC